MVIDRYTKFLLTLIAVSLFIYVLNITLSPIRAHAQSDIAKVGEKIDDLNKRMEALEGTIGGGEISTPSMEEKTFTFQGIPNLEQFCIEMEELSLTLPEVPSFTFPEMEITWPEIEVLCGME